MVIVTYNPLRTLVTESRPVQGSGLWAQINGLKKIVCEPRGTGDLFDKAMSDYYSAIRRGKGGIFMAICRGKVCFSHVCAGQQRPLSRSGLRSLCLCLPDKDNAHVPDTYLLVQLPGTVPGMLGRDWCTFGLSPLCCPVPSCAAALGHPHACDMHAGCLPYRCSACCHADLSCQYSCCSLRVFFVCPDIIQLDMTKTNMPCTLYIMTSHSRTS